MCRTFEVGAKWVNIKIRLGACLNGPVKTCLKCSGENDSK